MGELFAFAVLGVVSGCLYGLAATGLVLTYRTSGILNFAHGALAAAGAYCFYALTVDAGLPWPVAAVLSVLVLGPLMGLGLERMARRLAGADTVVQTVATIGIVLIVEGVAALWYGHDGIPFPQYLPAGTFELAGAVVSWGQVVIIAASLVCVAGLTVTLRATRAGVLMRAVVDSPELVGLSGVDPARVRRGAWMIGSVFAALAGVLLAPSVSLNAVTLVFLVVAAFGAAAVGRFASLPATFAGGLVIGLATSLSTYLIGDVSALRGLPASMPFVVLFLVLLLTPRRRLPQLGLTHSEGRAPWRPPLRAELTGGGLALVFLVLVPQLFGHRILVWSSALSFVLLFLSLGLLVRTSRQISLCHIGLAGFGAAVFAHLSTSPGMPWLVALLIAGLLTVPLGAIVAIPAMRLPGVFLALATLGFGVLLTQLLFVQPWLFGPDAGGLPVAQPGVRLFGLRSSQSFYYIALAVVVIAAVALIALTRTRLGTLLRAMADSSLALSTNGAAVNVTRVLVFCLSAFLAGVAGGLYSANLGNADSAAFPVAASLTVLALLIIQPGGIPWYAILAAVGYEVIPSYIDGATDWLAVLFGTFALLAALHRHDRDRGLNGAQRLVERVFGRREPRRTAGPAPSAEAGHRPSVAPDRGGLVVRGLTVTFGGTVAVDGLSLTAPMGRVTGLIGPNGAGKTTTFNACSGLLRPRRGTIELHGTDVARMRPATRARRGLGRTFQKIELFESLTVRENIALGREAAIAGANPVRHVIGTPAERSAVDAAVTAAAATCGVTGLLDLRAGVLSTGQRRLVEFARCLAGGYDVLLLDEPSSGLDPVESAGFGRIVRRVVDERAVAVLLVEHDMSLVMEVCDYIHVLDFGIPLFEGTPAEVAASPAVREAYLGAETAVKTETSP